jgi:hypothetical protein
MATTNSKVTAEAQTGRYSSEDIHKALFLEEPKPRTLEELKEGVRQYVRGRRHRHSSISGSDRA